MVRKMTSSSYDKISETLKKVTGIGLMLKKVAVTKITESQKVSTTHQKSATLRKQGK